VIDAAVLIRTARLRAGRSLRQLADAAGTSHSTIATYERGAKVPTVSTLDRLVRACGYEPRVTLSAAGVASDDARLERGQELYDALELADAFPVRHAATLLAPRFAWTGSSSATTVAA
jgi:transcriptional regulator with XRE-family HTH domain